MSEYVAVKIFPVQVCEQYQIKALCLNAVVFDFPWGFFLFTRMSKYPVCCTIRNIFKPFFKLRLHCLIQVTKMAYKEK